MSLDLAHTPAARAGYPEPAIGVEQLTKSYGARTVVDAVSFTVPRGSVTGLIGPNGAGKTTLIAMLLGLVRPASGTARVLGEPISAPARYLQRVGALIESPAFHPGASAESNLRALAVLGGHDPAQVPSLLDRVGLNGRGTDRYATFSLGMKQRLGIAAALLGDPELVVLDEPTNGLDPVGMREIRTLVSHLADEGRTVVVSSHLLAELEQVCTHLVALDAGRLVFAGAPDTLGSVPRCLLVLVRNPDRHRAALRSALGGPRRPLTDVSDGVAVELAPEDVADDVASDAVRRIQAAGLELTGLTTWLPDLESRYLDLVRRPR